MALPTVHSIRSGRKLSGVRASVKGSAVLSTGLELVTAAVAWTDEFGEPGPLRTVCGHVSTSTMTLLESAGETYCARCFAALKQLVKDYDAGHIDAPAAAARLRGFGRVRQDEIPRFLRQLKEPAMPSDLGVARATMRRLSDRVLSNKTAPEQHEAAGPPAPGITVRCEHCHRALLDDPQTWSHGHFDPHQLGLEMLAARSRPRPRNRLDLPERRGGLVRSAVDILLEDLGQGRGSRLHVRPHRRPGRLGQCAHSPSIGFDELVVACRAAERAGRDHIDL
jgi:hypothetical protein